MRVVCIKKYKSQGLQLELTYGKSYEVIPRDFVESDKHNYWIVNDRGRRNYYSRDTFVTEEDWREGRIDQILC